MARTKRFKTVQGYLRSTEESRILARQVKPGSDAERSIERGIINELLPQIGITETIANDEAPLAGVDRIRALTTDPGRIKTLDACRKWLDRPRLVGVKISAVRSMGASFIPGGMIFGGVDYSPEQTEAIKAICHEQNVGTEEAIEIWRKRRRSAITRSMTVAGMSFNQEETEAIEAIQRERKIDDIMEAIKIFQSAAAAAE